MPNNELTCDDRFHGHNNTDVFTFLKTRLLTWFQDQCALGYRIQSIQIHWSCGEATHTPSPSTHSPEAAWPSLHGRLHSTQFFHYAWFQRNEQCTLLQGQRPGFSHLFPREDHLPQIRSKVIISLPIKNSHELLRELPLEKTGVCPLSCSNTCTKQNPIFSHYYHSLSQHYYHRERY